MICKNCGFAYDGDYKYCPNCGIEADCRGSEENDTVVYREAEYIGDNGEYPQQFGYIQSENRNEYYNRDFGRQQPLYYVNPNKQTVKLRHILVIATSLIIFTLAGLGILASLIRSSRYSAGSIDDGRYFNEWANIQFDISDDWDRYVLGSTSGYTNSSTDCGFAAVNDANGNQFIIQFENLSKVFGDYDEDEYIDELKKTFAQSYGQYSLDYNNTEFEMRIAGREYEVLRNNVVSQNGEDYYTYCCVRIKNNYAIVISLSSYDEDLINRTLRQIKRVK